MTRPWIAGLVALVVASAPGAARAYTYCGGFFGDDVIMNPYPKPIETWQLPAEDQMAEWNLVQGDTSRPFQVLTTPIDKVLPRDGYNTVAFLTDANLQARWGVSFGSDVVAWTRYTYNGGECTKYTEADVILNADLTWWLEPDERTWFQSTVLHELGHVLGFDHVSDWLSIMNTGTFDRRLRGETLYMDDREGFRDYYGEYYPLPDETDMAIYPKYHDGDTPAWMSLSQTDAAPGDTIALYGFSIENRGTTTFGPLRVGIYLSTNTLISRFDTLLGWAQWPSYGRFTHSVVDFDAEIPLDTPPGLYYLGAIVDDLDSYGESDEDNNAMVAVDGTPDPALIVIQEPPTTSSTTSTTSTIPDGGATTTSLPTTACPGGFTCEDGTCRPVRVRRRECRHACALQFDGCRTTCLSAGHTPRRCGRQCKRSVIRECRRVRHCPFAVEPDLPASCSP